MHERLQAWHQAAVPPRCAESEDRRPPQRRPERGPGGLSEEVQRRVLVAIRERSLSKACKILQTSDLPPPEDPTNSLRALHPTGIPVPPVSQPPRGHFDFSVGEVEAALKSFPIGSSAGPSGLRPCHLLEMARGEERTRLLEALASFCSALANNSLSVESMKLLTTARLIAVSKPNGVVRPIAVG